MGIVQRSLCLILMSTGFAGCAAVPPTQQHAEKPLQVMMVEVQSSAKVSDLEQISSVKPPNDNPKDKDLERTFVDTRLSQISQMSNTAMANALQASGRFTVCNNPQVKQLVDQLGVANEAEILTDEMRGQLEAQHCGDALLRFRITDYGTIPKAWDTWIEVGTGVWIGGITLLAYSKPSSRPYIGAYLLSEVVQESAEAYVGYSLFGSVYTPVRIEVELIDLHTGKILWQDTNTGLAHQNSIFPFSTSPEQDKIATRLDLSLERSIQSLVSDLDSADLPEPPAQAAP